MFHTGCIFTFFRQDQHNYPKVLLRQQFQCKLQSKKCIQNHAVSSKMDPPNKITGENWFAMISKQSSCYNIFTIQKYSNKFGNQITSS